MVSERDRVHDEDKDYTYTVFRHVLYTVRADGSELTRLITSSYSHEIPFGVSPPVWSPEGQSIAFLYKQFGGRPESIHGQP